jgi:hypothetical protein
VPNLDFQIESAEAVRYAAAPILNLNIRIQDMAPAVPIHNVMLQCQIQIEPVKRKYTPAEQESLLDLFGEPSRWSQTLKPLLWANTSVVIPAFTGQTKISVPISCTFDFNVAATKYFHGLLGGDVPVTVLFSGTIFHDGGEHGGLQISKISWEREAKYRMPHRVWKDMMDVNYPNTAWLCLRRDVFEQLYRFKVSRGIPTWDQALESVLANADGAAGGVRTKDSAKNAAKADA